MSDHPYLIASIVFGILFVIVYIFVSVPRTIDMPGAESAQEDIETRKRKAQKILARTRVFGIGGVIVLCLFTYLIIWVATPAKKVYGALWPSATPTITSTATATATRTTTPTPRISPTSKLFGTITAYAGTPGTPAGTPKATTLQPSGSTGGGSVTVIQTRVVIQTRIVYITQFVVMTVPVTVVVTATPIPAASETPSITPTASETSTSTETPTPSATSTPTNTGTLVP